MLSYQVESYRRCLPELAELFPRHWAEIAVDKDIPLEPRYDVYLAMDAAGVVFLETVRDDRKLVGYFIGFITPGLHYESCSTCTEDIYWLAPEYRRGWVGVRLFRTVMSELRARKVQRLFVTTKVHAPIDRLLTFLGFKHVENGYSIRLD